MRRPAPSCPSPRTATALDIDLVVESEAWSAVAGLETAVTEAARLAYAAAEPGAHPSAQVTVALLADAEVAALNARFRGLDRPTNVLSFPTGPTAIHAEIDSPALLGDIVLAYETVAAEAQAEEIALLDHVRHLVVHGVLHLLGFDHEVAADAVRMEALETRILAGMGVADPYCRLG